MLRLHLHFDVNKTVIMEDAASGQSLEECCQNILAESCYGVVENEEWKVKKSDVFNQDGNNVLYGDYTRLKYNKSESKAKRMTFCEEGNPGEGQKEVYEDMLRVVRKGGYFVASFEKLLKWLKEQKDFEFRIYFRTFGSDLPELTQHWNALCDELKMEERKIDEDKHYGKFERSSKQSSSLKLNGNEHKGFEAIYSLWQQDSLNTLALQEHWRFWNDHDEHKETGKLLLIDPADKVNHHLFFDDNAFEREEGDETQIVDLRIRDKDSFRAANINEGHNVYVVEADPFHVIRNEDYFIDKVRERYKQVVK